MNKQMVLAAAALASIGLIGWAAYEMLSPGESSQTSQNEVSRQTAGLNAALAQGAMATFDLTEGRPSLPLDMQIQGPDGTMTLGDLRGQVLLINLWAEWCAPCIEEMPTLAALEADMGSADFRVVPISIDRSLVAQAQTVLEKFKAANLTTLADPSMRLMGDLGIIGLPATLLVDREGREIGRLVGPADWNSPDAKALVKAALAS
ncbi:TlpA disulfide reductase family protein [Iodidimonas gelatinilytica]|nr:TlpA disulfide reductase family protein [Iodidimonas gelatinilytica]